MSNTALNVRALRERQNCFQTKNFIYDLGNNNVRNQLVIFSNQFRPKVKSQRNVIKYKTIQIRNAVNQYYKLKENLFKLKQVIISAFKILRR